LDERLDPYIRTLLEIHGTVKPEAYARALQADLGGLIADARARHPLVVGSSSRVIVLLDGIDDSGVELIEILHDRLLGDYSVGTATEPIPVVLAFAYTSRDNLLRQLAEGQSGKPWLDVRELRPFRPDGEDLLAYQQVMLHPFNLNRMPGFSDLPWIFNRDLAPALWDQHVKATRLILKGEPSVFLKDVFYHFLVMSQAAGFVRAADDERLLATFRDAGERQ